MSQHMDDQQTRSAEGEVASPAVSEAALDRLATATVYDSQDEKIGGVGRVYLRDETGRPSWITVNTGLFGTRQSLIPMHGVDTSTEVVRVPYTKDVVKGAPNVEADQHISADEEQRLYAYYREHGWAGQGRSGAQLEEHAPRPADRPADLSQQGRQAHSRSGAQLEEHAPRPADRPADLSEPRGTGVTSARDVDEREPTEARLEDMSGGEALAAAGAGMAAMGVAGHDPDERENVERSETGGLDDEQGRAAGGTDTSTGTPWRESTLEEVRDGGYGIGSAAPLGQGVRPLGHGVPGWRETMSYRLDPAIGSRREPDVWFLDENAARNAGFRPTH